MTIELLDKNTERKAVDTVKTAVDVWSSGEAETPTEAIIKAATEKDFTPEMLSRIVESFNGAVQLAHFETAEHDKRADTIPLADACDVVTHFFPDKVETKQEKAAATRLPDGYEISEVRDFMTVKPKLEKTAGTKITVKPRQYKRSRADMLKTAHRDKAIAQRQAEVLRGEARGHMDNIIKTSASLVEYFRTLGHTPFMEVEKRASAYFGKGISTLLNAVYSEGSLEKLHEKRAVCRPTDIAHVDEKQAPYNLIKAAIDNGEAFARKTYQIVDIVNEAEQKLAEALPRIDKEAQDPLESFEASLGLTAPEEKAPQILTPISDPAHEAELAGINQHFMLNDLMTNDPVISAVEPQSVLDAFNKLSVVAPMVARDPVMLQGIMRRLVQQPDIDPFEMKSMVDLDSALRSREAPEGEKSRSYTVV